MLTLEDAHRLISIDRRPLTRSRATWYHMRCTECSGWYAGA